MTKNIFVVVMDLNQRKRRILYLYSAKDITSRNGFKAMAAPQEKLRHLTDQRVANENLLKKNMAAHGRFKREDRADSKSSERCSVR